MKTLARALRAARCDSGVAAIELVLVIPLAVTMLFGYSEIYFYLRAQNLLEHATFTLADSLSQMSGVYDDNGTSNADALGSIWNAANSLAAPLTLNGSGGITITSICDSTASCAGGKSQQNTAGTAKVAWTRSAPWNATNTGTRISTSNPLPTGWPFKYQDSAIVVEMAYNYDPFPMVRTYWPGAPGKQVLYSRVYVRPRYYAPLALNDASQE